MEMVVSPLDAAVVVTVVLVLLTGWPPSLLAVCLLVLATGAPPDVVLRGIRNLTRRPG